MKLKKVFAVLLALVLLLGIVPAGATELHNNDTNTNYCTVHFINDGNDYKQLQIPFDTEVELPDGPDKEGNHFVGWLRDNKTLKPGEKYNVGTPDRLDFNAVFELHTAGSAQEENRVEPQPGIAGSYDSVVYCTVCGRELSRTKTEIPALEVPEAPPAEYTITFKNEYGEVIYSTTVTAGTVPSYPYSTLTKEENGYVSYSFAGWSPAPYAADKDETYTAVFTETTKYYNITFVNTDGTAVLNGQWPYGEYPGYSGLAPTREPDQYYTYEFEGWTPSISRVTGDAVYTASYKAQLRYYDVKFITRNPDKSDNYLTFATQRVRVGEKVTDPGPAESFGVYKFMHWTSQSEIHDGIDPYPKFDFENSSVSGDMILEAVYMESLDDGGVWRRAIPSKEQCYIATFLYGSYDCPQVWALRRFRDMVLKQTEGGRQLIAWYYNNGEGFVEHYGENPLVTAAFQAILDTGVELLKSIGFEDTEYTDGIWVPD